MIPGFFAAAASASGGGGGGTDPYFSSVIALLHFDDTNGSTEPVDETGKIWSGDGNAQVSTSAPLTGSGSGLLDGGGDYFTTPDHADFDLGSGDFTLEIDIEFGALPASSDAMGFASQWQTGGNLSWFFYVFNGGSGYSLYFTYSTNGSSSSNCFVAWSPSASTKYKLCVERNGTDLRFYVNGAQQGSTQSIAGSLYNGTAPLWIGGTPSTGANYFLNAKVDEFRLTGVARYVGSYTPVEPFPDS